MCLRIEDETVKIAEEDITVFKHVIKLMKDDEVEYRTSYQKAVVALGKTYTSILNVGSDLHGEPTIEQGLHSFANQEDARAEAMHYNEVLVECVIPKGSEYYEGIFALVDAYASNKLTYVRIIEDFNQKKQMNWTT